MSWLKSNFKIVWNSRKYTAILICQLLLFGILYAPSAVDVLNIIEIYFPLMSVAVFADIFYYDKRKKIGWSISLKKVSYSKIYYTRIVISVTLNIIILVAVYLLFVIKHWGDTFVVSKNFMYYLLILSLPVTCLMGALTNLITLITGNIVVGVSVCFLYWLFWNVKMELHSPFNIFMFSNYGDDNMLLLSKIAALLIAFILFAVNGKVGESIGERA